MIVKQKINCSGKVKFAVHNGSVWICVLLLSIAAIMIAVIGPRDNLSCIKAKWFTPYTRSYLLTHYAMYIAASHSYILHYILPLPSDTYIAKLVISTWLVMHIAFGVPNNAKQTLFIYSNWYYWNSNTNTWLSCMVHVNNDITRALLYL